MENDFDRWNKIKKRLARDAPLPPAFPKDGEVWMCSLGKNLGREQDGGSRDFSRPVLVVKKFNNEIFWVVPLSTKQKPLDFYFNYTDPSGAPVAAVLAQLRLVSINRLRRDIYVLPPALLHEVRAQLRAFLS
jgi:mRNA interferase MazF